MIWKIEWDDRARRELRKLDPQAQMLILKYLRDHIEKLRDPRAFGHSLSGNKAGLWRYRVENYRIICKIEDNNLIVLVVGVGHRKEIYES